MIGPILGFTAAVAAAAVAFTSDALGPVPGSRSVVSPFGGSANVHLARIGQIDVDLETSGPAGLRRVACAGASSPATACFVARR
jgi:hypothetical protein